MPTQKELMGDLRDELEYLNKSVQENTVKYLDPLQVDTLEPPNFYLQRTRFARR